MPRASRRRAVGGAGGCWRWRSAVALLAAAVAVAAEPPRWVRHALGDGVASAPRVRASLGGRCLPGGCSSPRRMGRGSCAATGRGCGSGRGRARPGRRAGSTWPPGAAASSARWRPNGRVAWTIAALGPVRDAAWSPDGYRIAYRRDDALAIVAGDGTGARVLAQPVRAVAPAWRPGAPHTLAWVGASGRVEVRDVDTGALVVALARERRRGARAGVVGRRPSPAGPRRRGAWSSST